MIASREDSLPLATYCFFDPAGPSLPSRRFSMAYSRSSTRACWISDFLSLGIVLLPVESCIVGRYQPSGSSASRGSSCSIGWEVPPGTVFRAAASLSRAVPAPQVKGPANARRSPSATHPHARKTIASRYQTRRANNAQDRIAAALEAVADEATLIRAELGIMRTLLAMKVAEGS